MLNNEQEIMQKVQGMDLSHLSNEQINGVKAALNDIAQGCITLIKVLSMAQIPEHHKYPEGRPDE